MKISKNPRSWSVLSSVSLACLFLGGLFTVGWANSPQPQENVQRASGQAPEVLGDSLEEAIKRSRGCKSCHTSTDNETMHPTKSFQLGCTSCHGGDAGVELPPGVQRNTEAYNDLEEKAHKVVPRSELHQSANREREYTKWMKRSKEYIKFVNPGDLRVADQTCGGSGCHTEEVHRVRTSMMTHGAMLWAAALYNNGSFPYKDAHFGQSYSPDGIPQDLKTSTPPTEKETHDKGILPRLVPLERWEVSQPGNVLRVFERGGGQRSEVGNPQDEDQPGRPDVKLSDRGFGTLLRTDPVFLGLQKTRLFDPLLSFPGTNDHPGDYRGSGCSGCHVIYANDRDPEHSAEYSRYGNAGRSFSADKSIPKDISGFPIRHQLAKSIPSSQCVVCHVHPGTNVLNSYYGTIWWDNESDGELLYPKKEKHPSDDETAVDLMSNPEAASVKGNWSDPKFLTHVSELNPQMKHVQLADFHGHGWL